jgi:hypothetical protein
MEPKFACQLSTRANDRQIWPESTGLRIDPGRTRRKEYQAQKVRYLNQCSESLGE